MIRKPTPGEVDKAAKTIKWHNEHIHDGRWMENERAIITCTAITETPLEYASLIIRQQEYDSLVRHFESAGLVPADKASDATFSMHQRIVAIIDGEVDDPRKVEDEGTEVSE